MFRSWPVVWLSSKPFADTAAASDRPAVARVATNGTEVLFLTCSPVYSS